MSAPEPGGGPDEGGSFAAYAVAGGAVAVLLVAAVWPAAERVVGDGGLARLLQAAILVTAAHIAGLAAEAVVGACRHHRR